MGWADAARRDDKVVRRRHARACFDDLIFVVGNDFDALEVDAEGEAEFGKIGRIGVCCLANRSVINMSFFSRSQWAQTSIEK